MGISGEILMRAVLKRWGNRWKRTCNLSLKPKAEESVRRELPTHDLQGSWSGSQLSKLQMEFSHKSGETATEHLWRISVRGSSVMKKGEGFGVRECF